MKVRKHQVEVTYYQSEIRPYIQTEDRVYKDIIQWADDTAYAWAVVTENHSLRWGVSSSAYFGRASGGNSVPAVLARLKLFHATCTDPRDCRTEQVVIKALAEAIALNELERR